jgi:hypothetical protein
MLSFRLNFLIHHNQDTEKVLGIHGVTHDNGRKHQLIARRPVPAELTIPPHEDNLQRNQTE